MKNTIVLLVIFTALQAQAKHLHYEKYYQDKFCSMMGGVTEYVLPDKTRIDCLTDEYAIEVDFAEKWAESIGQALYYARMTGKKPAIYLILENESDNRFLERIKKAINIKTFVD